MAGSKFSMLMATQGCLLRKINYLITNYLEEPALRAHPRFPKFAWAADVGLSHSLLSYDWSGRKDISCIAASGGPREAARRDPSRRWHFRHLLRLPRLYGSAFAMTVSNGFRPSSPWVTITRTANSTRSDFSARVRGARAQHPTPCPRGGESRRTRLRHCPLVYPGYPGTR